MSFLVVLNQGDDVGPCLEMWMTRLPCELVPGLGDGDLLAEKYKVERVLGSNVMGVGGSQSRSARSQGRHRVLASADA